MLLFHRKQNVRKFRFPRIALLLCGHILAKKKGCVNIGKMHNKTRKKVQKNAVILTATRDKSNQKISFNK